MALALQTIGTAAIAQGGVDGLSPAPVLSVQHERLQGGATATGAASLALPFEAQTGLAAFWSGADFIVLADQPVPALAHASGGSGLFSSFHVTLMDHATLVQIHLPAHPTLKLLQQKNSWLLTAEPQVKQGGVGVQGVAEPGGVRFALEQPGRVLSMPDPASGARLLVATSRRATGGLGHAMQGVGYTLRPSAEGVVVMADADQITLRTIAQGAVLQALTLQPLPIGLPLNPVSPDPAAGKDWQWLGLQRTEPESQQRQRKALADKLAHTPENQKAALQVSAAQMALSMADVAEAARMLAQASATSGTPHQNEKPGEIFLRAAVGLLAGQPEAAHPLNDSSWYAWPELHVWQGLYALYTGQNSQISSVLLAQGIKQVAAYPTLLCERLLPQIALAVARYGAADARQDLASLPDGPAYDLARAIDRARDGHTESARVALENLTATSNTEIAAYAQVALVRLLRDTDQIAPDMALEAYDKLLKQPDTATLPAGPRQQATIGRALALAQNGQPRAALAQLQLLKPGLELPEDVVSEVYQQILYRLVFGTLHTEGSQRGFGPQTSEGLSVEDVVLLVAQHLPHVADGAPKAKLLAGYGRLLLALKKANEAQHVLEQASYMQPNPLARSEMQDLLAQAALLQGNINAAQHATDQIVFSVLEPDLAARKAYDSALVAQARGEVEKALSLLASDETDAGLLLRAQIYEAEHRWAEAVLVLGRFAGRAIPETGALTESQRALALRLATDAASAHDKPTVQRLKAWLGGRSLGHERDNLLTLQLKAVGLGGTGP